MKQSSRWLLAILASAALWGAAGMPLERLYAEPAPERGAVQALVNINKADAGELETIRGIGPLLAQRIMEYRQANGRFEKLEDLVRVPGIGQAKFEKIKSQITL